MGRKLTTALNIVLVSIIVMLLATIIQSYVSGFYPLVVVKSGSMRPVIDVGDVLIVTPIKGQDVFADPVNGDVIIFYKPPYYGDSSNLIVHRAIARTNEGIITKGDANSYPDVWSPVPFDHVIARWTGIKIPYWMGIGPLYLFLRGEIYPPYGKILLMLLIVLSIVMIIFEVQKSRRKQASSKSFG